MQKLPSQGLYLVKSKSKNAPKGPVYISHSSRSGETIYVFEVYPQLPREEILNREKGVTYAIYHPAVRRRNLVKIPDDHLTKQLLIDWVKIMTENNRYPGWVGNKPKIPQRYLRSFDLGNLGSPLL